jgi:NitT/TauT family transport system permease protein
MQQALRRPAGLLAARIAIFALLLVAWQLASGPLIPRFWISDPIAIGAALWQWIADGSIWVHVGATLLTMALGYGLGGLLGIALGFLLGSFPRVLDMVSPVITGLFCLPKVALLPLYVIFLGIGIASKVVLVISVVMFLTLYSTIDGVRDVDPDLINSLRLMGASRLEILTKVVIPSARPWVFTGLRVAVSYALTTTVVGELLSSNRGIGFLIESSAARFNAASVFAAVTVLVVVSVAITEGLVAVERRRSPEPAVD